jgi:hypothetical protein
MNKFTGQMMLKLCLGLVFAANLIFTPSIGQKVKAANRLAAAVQMSAQKVTINGKVKEVTASALTVVDDQKAEQSIGLDAKTKITKAGKNATIVDIKADDAVVVVASKGEDGVLTAVTVKVP